MGHQKIHMLVLWSISRKCFSVNCEPIRPKVQHKNPAADLLPSVLTRAATLSHFFLLCLPYFLQSPFFYNIQPLLLCEGNSTIVKTFHNFIWVGVNETLLRDFKQLQHQMKLQQGCKFWSFHHLSRVIQAWLTSTQSHHFLHPLSLYFLSVFVFCLRKVSLKT